MLTAIRILIVILTVLEHQHTLLVNDHFQGGHQILKKTTQFV